MADLKKQNTDEPQEYLNKKISTLIADISEGYGGALLDELIHRLERTVADFHKEVNLMLDTLKNNSANQRKYLKHIAGDKPEKSVDDYETPANVSDWEKNLEDKHSKEKMNKEVISIKKVTDTLTKKKSFFKRKGK